MKKGSPWVIQRSLEAGKGNSGAQVRPWEEAGWERPQTKPSKRGALVTSLLWGLGLKRSGWGAALH